MNKCYYSYKYTNSQYMNKSVYTILNFLKIIFWRSTRLSINFFFFSGFKKVKIDFYIYNHVILDKKLLSLIICSCEIVSFEITSVKMS